MLERTSQSSGYTQVLLFHDNTHLNLCNLFVIIRGNILHCNQRKYLCCSHVPTRMHTTLFSEHFSSHTLPVSRSKLFTLHSCSISKTFPPIFKYSRLQAILLLSLAFCPWMLFKYSYSGGPQLSFLLGLAVTQIWVPVNPRVWYLWCHQVFSFRARKSMISRC